MATREEAHSTRGRANVLRLAMAGKLEGSGLTDEGVRHVLDLCLECRACRAECPVNVDMARFKSEFLAAYWQQHGTPMRARVLGHVHEIARWGSSSAIARTSAPSRARPGAITGIPWRIRGAAVTGPTQAASTSERSASRTASAPAPAAASRAPTAGAEVKVMASTSRLVIRSTRRCSGAESSGGAHR